MNVTLEKYDEIYLEDIKNYYLEEVQLEYTALPVWGLEEALKNPEKMPVLVVSESRMIGFFILDRGEARAIYSNNKNAILLRSFSIENQWQGKGYAKKALSLLKNFINSNFIGIEEVVLGVNHRNSKAYSLYLNVGFEDKGENIQGTKGLQHVMHMKI